MARFAVALTAGIVLVSCAPAPSPDGIADQTASPIETSDGRGSTSAIEVADGRGGWTEADASAWMKAPPVMQAIAAARSFGSAEGDYEEDVLVLATATGAFSRPGVEERVVLYRMSLYPRGFPRKGLALLEDGQLVRNFAFTGLGHDLMALPDIDGDGRDEILIAIAFGMGGQHTWGVSIASFGDEGLEDVGETTLYDDSCGTGNPEFGGPRASRIWVTPESGMMIQRYRRESCESQAWNPDGEPEPFTLTGAGETTYTEISAR